MTDTFDPTISGETLGTRRTDASMIAHRWFAASASSPRRPNQDAWQADDGVWAVADGMGGLSHGAEAARFVVQRFVALAHLRPTADLARFVRELSAELVERVGSSSGATLVGGVLHESSLDIVHVGDSRVYCLREDSFELVTRDHTVREFALETGTDPNSLTPRQIQGLTSFVGQPPESMTIGLRSFNVTAGNRVVLLTDGVHRSIPFDELENIVRSERVEQIPDRLIESARRHLADDDATAVVVEVTGS